jgi:hypothetical protein
MKYLLLLLLSVPSFADVKDWSKKNQRLWYSYITLSSIDVLQTYDMIQCQKLIDCRFEEGSPFLNKRPEIEDVLLIKFIAGGIIYYSLDKQVDYRRTRDLWIINGLQLSAVINNHHVGLRFKYVF